MSWLAVLIALAPENVLLAGIVVLIGVEIYFTQFQGGADAVRASPWRQPRWRRRCSMSVGMRRRPSPAIFRSIRRARSPRRSCWRWRSPCCCWPSDDFRDDGQFHILVLSSLYGFCLLLSSDSFLTLFLGLEFMALPVYVLVLLAFKRPESPEAALKYLILGGTATAMFLMGVSLLYGGSGTLSISVFAAGLRSADTMATAGVTLILLAFFLKGAIVPFHAWAPDAYEGASIPVTAYMATIIKAGVLLAALRLFGTEVVSRPVDDLLAFLPLVSIVWGNLAAMRQKSFRRMIAYSSIAHAGYLFYAFLGDGAGRFQAIVFYLVAYGLMNLLAFASLPEATTTLPATVSTT